MKEITPEVRRFTIEDLAAGRCAVKNDGTLEQLRKVLSKTFPNDYCKVNGDARSYVAWKDVRWKGDDMTNLPSQSVSDFLTPAEPEFKNGDEVEVSDGSSKWIKRIYIGKKTVLNDHPHVCMVIGGNGVDSWKYCRHPKQKVTYTKQQVAEALGVDLKTLVITD